MIKKINIYKKIDKKFKLQFTALGLAIILGGCGLKSESNIKTNNYNNNNSNSSTSSFVPEVNTDPIIEYPEIEEDLYLKIINNNINLTEQERQNMNNLINNIEVNYELSELYNVDELFNKYNSLDNKNYNFSSGKNIIKNNQISVEDLIKIVKKNNSDYLEENHAIAQKYKDTTDSLISKTCGVIVKYLNNFLISNSNINTEELELKLENLKIFEYSGFSYASYNSSDGIMCISSPTIKVIEENQNDTDAFKKLIEHELIHLLQSATIKEYNMSDYSIRFGPCYNFDDLKVNSGYWNWYFEGAAEKIATMYNEADVSLTYSNDINSIMILESINLISDNIQVNDLINLSIQPDIENFFNYFNCENESDKKEIVKLMFSFNLINHDSVNASSKNFFDEYEKKYGEKMSYSSRGDLNYSLYGSIAQSVAKQAYNNLLNKTVDKEINVKNLFDNLYVIEHQLSRLTKCTQESRAEFNKEFFENYSLIQNQLFEIIAYKLGTTSEEIEMAFTRHCKNFNIEEFNIAYISEEKNEYYKKELKKGSSKKENIILIYKKYIDSNIYNNNLKK